MNDMNVRKPSVAEAKPQSASKPVSIRDVAKLAGVSMQSVSRVANGSPSVSPQMRERVTRAMTELGYRPSRMARALRSGRTKIIGIMVEKLETAGSALMLESTMAAASRSGYGLTLLPAKTSDHQSLISTSPFVASLNVDGIIANNGGAICAELDELFPGLPVVSVGAVPNPSLDWSSVDMDQNLISALAVEHLFGLGHKTVYHVGGMAGSGAAQYRAQAWARLLREHGCAVPAFEYAGWWADDGYRAGLKLAEDPACTAVYCANDTLAVGVIKALRDRGLRVPEDVSVVGVDDSIGGYYAGNDLTTVRQRYDVAGEELVRLLLDRINGSDKPEHVLVGADLIVRGTTAPYRPRA
ncbi:LacI family DNA-binding transcriptional regulator [Bifidobacterium aerophilum]|nr:LacI family DNA-binding transcriptional regulator [Bifidobacterium aerophilum]